MNEQKDQDYPFIKETIKKRPIDKRAAMKRLLLAVICGTVFGLCAGAAFIFCISASIENLEEKGEKQERVQLSPPASDSEKIIAEGEASADMNKPVSNGETAQAFEAEPAKQEEALPAESEVTVDEIQDFYRVLQQIAEEPKKALVRVAGTTGDSDLLNDSLLTYGDEGGIVFYKNEKEFYILTTSDRLEEMEKFWVTFSNGDTAEGSLCGVDRRTRIVVIRVSAKNVYENTWKEIPAVTLSPEISQEQMQPVIAIGSPVGDMDSLIYGSVTSVSGRLNIPDAEYALITTNIAAAENGGGVLLDMQGRMTGLIISDEEEKDTSVVRAVSVAQLGPLFEKLTNGEKLLYAGVIGFTISAEQAGGLEIPQGVYVERVETDSPAMEAGIQSGDIIHRIDGSEIKTMEDYSKLLQEKKPGSRMKITLYRKNASGAYVDVELSIIIEEK